MERTGFFTKILVLTGFVGIAKCNGLNSDALMPDIDVRILSLKNCSDDNDYAMVYRDVSVEKKSKNLYTLQAKILVTRDMPGSIKVVNKVDACKQRDNNCETFTTLTTEDACKELEEEKGQLYQTFKEAKMEHLRCPLKKDTYILSPCEIKVPEGAKSLVAKSENWKVISRMFHGEEELTCFIVLLEMKPKESGRKKNKPAKEEKEKNDVEEKEEDKGKEKEKGKGKEKEKGKGKEKENNKKKGR